MAASFEWKLLSSRRSFVLGPLSQWANPHGIKESLDCWNLLRSLAEQQLWATWALYDPESRTVCRVWHWQHVATCDNNDAASMSEHLSKTCQRTHLGKIARQVLLTEPYDISNDIVMHDMFDFDGVLSLCLCHFYHLWPLWNLWHLCLSQTNTASQNIASTCRLILEVASHLTAPTFSTAILPLPSTTIQIHSYNIHAYIYNIQYTIYNIAHVTCVYIYINQISLNISRSYLSTFSHANAS